jgi:diguanylate cyclase (GGDEF)-like protein/PAS domain S-box-containing protein
MRRLAIALTFAAAFLAGAQAASDTPPAADFGGSQGVIDLNPILTLFKPTAGAASGQSSWYTFTATNSSKRSATRVLQAVQPPGSGLSFFPKATRPKILQLASTNPGVVIEPSNAYGRNGFRVTIPAATSAPVAVLLENAQSRPSLLAWTEPSLAARNRQIAIFIAAVAGLIGAAAAIAAGIAVMTHHIAPRWAAIALFLMLLTRLAAIGMFDGSLVTSIGGPYGLTAMLAGLSLVSGVQFVEVAVPIRRAWPGGERWLRWGAIAVAVISVFAYVGIPGATVLTDIILVCGTLAVAGYLFYCAREKCRPARVLLPSAGLFALLSLCAAFTALGGFGNNVLTPDLAGGFAAAGAVLLVLAVATGEGIAVLPPFGRHSHIPPPRPTPTPPPPLPPSSPQPLTDSAPRAAIEAIGASRQGVIELDFIDDTVTLSAEAAVLLGSGASKMPQATWSERIHPDDRAVYEHAISQYKEQSGLAFRIEFRARSEDGQYPWCELRATMKGPDAGAAERCVGLLADVTIRKDAEAALMDRALRDPLTGLGNRVALMEQLENLAGKLADATFAMLDIDRFKAIHASLGDAGGDDVLSSVAKRLSRKFFGFAQIFRVGGDAFAVLMRDPSVDPGVIGAELVKTCSSAHLLDGRSVFAPASVGVTLGRDARDPIDLLKNAELALMQAKRQGGDCARLYSPELEALAPADSVVLDAELRGALERGEIEVFYQPIVRLADRTVAGFEALLRWRHPTKGLVAPVDFIAHSEETGLIVGLGRLALERAAKDLAQWQRFFPLGEPLFVSVNLSRRQLRETDFEVRLADLLSTAELAAGSFKLEITESAIATDADVRGLAARARALGAGLAIDDFGTGMSSLSQLADLPFDTVKIDKSFLARQGGPDAVSSGDVVLASIVSLAHELKRNVIVEGVETEADARRLTELGCEYAQGFLFSEPLSMQDTLGYIARRFRVAGTRRSSGATGFG